MLRRLSALRPIPIFAACALAIATVLLRHHLSGRYTFYFLLFNLALAFVPYALAAIALIPGSARGRLAALAAVGPLWLLFFPNAPYLFTDLLHLRERPPVPV